MPSNSLSIIYQPWAKNDFQWDHFYWEKKKYFECGCKLILRPVHRKPRSYSRNTKNIPNSQKLSKTRKAGSSLAHWSLVSVNRK